MAEQEDVIKQRVFELRKEVETLRDTEAKLKSHEVCCQKAKEWFLNKKSKFVDDQPVKQGCMIDGLNECKSDMQFCEILALLSEIKNEQKRLLMLKHQLHSSQMQEEVGLLNDILLKQSVLLTNMQRQSQCATHSENDSPLAMWFAEISKSTNKSSEGKMEEKFTDSSKLFYNVCYTDTKEPRDLLVEKIYKKKSKRHQRNKDVPRESLQFSTCHRGYCVQVVVSLSDDTRHDEEGSGILDPSSYHIHFDIHLNDAKERLLEYLESRKPLEDFVRQFVWREIEKLPT